MDDRRRRRGVAGGKARDRFPASVKPRLYEASIDGRLLLSKDPSGGVFCAVVGCSEARTYELLKRSAVPLGAT